MSSLCRGEICMRNEFNFASVLRQFCEIFPYQIHRTTRNSILGLTYPFQLCQRFLKKILHRCFGHKICFQCSSAGWRIQHEEATYFLKILQIHQPNGWWICKKYFFSKSTNYFKTFFTNPQTEEAI